MSLGITWCTIEEASAKYSLNKSQIMKWVNEGVVRSEESDGKVLLINLADLELEVQERATHFNE